MKTSTWFILSLGVVYLLGFLVLGSTLYRLQYMDTGEFKADLEQQNTRRIRIPGLRGRILDRNGAADEVDGYVGRNKLAKVVEKPVNRFPVMMQLAHHDVGKFRKNLRRNATVVINLD